MASRKGEHVDERDTTCSTFEKFKVGDPRLMEYRLVGEGEPTAYRAELRLVTATSHPLGKGSWRVVIRGVRHCAIDVDLDVARMMGDSVAWMYCDKEHETMASLEAVAIERLDLEPNARPFAKCCLFRIILVPPTGNITIVGDGCEISRLE